jgi:hypothetical protein
MKEFYFLCGLPRAGNTLLSSILNQNKNILVSPNSVVPEILYRINETKNSHMYNNFPMENNLDDLLKETLNCFYKSNKQKYIIDRGSWSTPYTYTLLKKIFKKEIKVIFLVRNILDVLASFIDMCNKYPDFYINKKYNLLDQSTLIKDPIESKCDLLMKEEEMIHKQLYSLKYLLDNKLPFLLIEFDDLIKNTETVIDKIYSYLKIKKFKHNLKTIEKYNFNKDIYNDDILGAPLHNIKKNGIQRSNIDYRNILNEKVIKKYSNMEFWK